MKNLFLILSAFICLAGRSQTGVVRLEFEAALNSDIYQLVPLGSQGFLVFFETREVTGDNSKNWLFTFYDPAFTEVWKTNIPVIADASYQDFVKKDSLVYLFFLNPDKIKSGTDNFQLLTLDLAKALSFETKGSLPAESTYIKFCIADRRMFLGLDLKNEQASICSIDLDKGPVYEFQIPYPDQNFIEDLIYDPFTQEIKAVVTNFLSRKQNKMFLVVLDPDANFKNDIEINPVVTGKYLNTARMIATDSIHLMLIGCYGGIAAKIPSLNEYFGIESAGVFTTRISEKKQEFMNYFNFIEFKNLRAGVSARDFYRLQKKKERESPEYSMNYELITHDPELHDTTLVMMFEAFYPEFRTVSDISYDYWGRPVTHSYTVFDGYRFFNSILTGFNEDGALAWDNSLEINIAPTTQLDKKSAYFFDGEPAILFYNDGSKIFYRVCLGNAELEPSTALDLETSEFGDKITAIGQNHLVHWYDYYFWHMAIIRSGITCSRRRTKELSFTSIRFPLNSMLSQKVYLTGRFIYFLLHSGNRYRVHSPFLYALTNEVLRNNGKQKDFERIEQMRRECLKSVEIIEKTDYSGSGYDKTARVYRVSIRKIARTSLTPARNARRLHRLVRFMKATSILEIGTSLGITTAYLASANPDAKVITLEGCPELCQRAREHFDKLGIRNIELLQGPFEENLAAALTRIGKVDLVYIDGNHHKEAMMDYYKQCLEYSGNKTIMIFDDIHSSPEMEEAWEIIRMKEEVRVSLDLFSSGWLIFRKESSKQHFRLRYI